MSLNKLLSFLFYLSCLGAFAHANAQTPEGWINFDGQAEVFEGMQGHFNNDFFNAGVIGDAFFEEVAEQRRRETPNYNFSLDSFEQFMPGTPLAQITNQYGPGERIKGDRQSEIQKFYVAHIRYKFPVFVQVALRGPRQGEILDFMARLPNYFLHDVFHQSLINRYGSQDSYFRKEPHAIYRWNNIEGNSLTYAGACTINCFPIYFAVTPLQVEGVANYRSIPERLAFTATPTD